MHPLRTAGVALIVLGTAGVAHAQAPVRCSDIADPAARHACYQNQGQARPAEAMPSRGMPAAPAMQRRAMPAQAMPVQAMPAQGMPAQGMQSDDAGLTSDPAHPGVHIGHNERPTRPGDEAFRGSAQQVPPQNLGTVQPTLQAAGHVPVTSGPGSQVPVVTARLPSLRPVPGGRWQLSLDVANNGGRVANIQLLCGFENGQRRVAELTVMMPGVRGGDRVAAQVAGPPVTTYVDNASCQVLSPLQ